MKTIQNLAEEWVEKRNYPRSHIAVALAAFKAGHKQGASDSKELLKRSFDTIPRYCDDEDLPIDLEDHLGYLEYLEER